MILIDTGYCLALLRPRDVLYPRAQAWALAVREPLVVTEYVLLEAVNSLSAPATRAKAPVLIARIRSDPNIEVIPASSELFEAGLQLHAQRPDKDWSLTDCISFVIMRRRGILRALAHDHHFEQAGFEALLRREPTL
jgi:hypothetical protein